MGDVTTCTLLQNQITYSANTTSSRLIIPNQSLHTVRKLFNIVSTAGLCSSSAAKSLLHPTHHYQREHFIRGTHIMREFLLE